MKKYKSVCLSLLLVALIGGQAQAKDNNVQTCGNDGYSCFNEQYQNVSALIENDDLQGGQVIYAYNDNGNGSDSSGMLAANGPASKHGTVIFNPNKRQFTAYDASGKLVASGKAVGGRSYCPDLHRSCRTPSGRFYVYNKGPVQCRSSKFPVGKGGAYMPYCMFFRGGYAIHGSNDLPNYNASHGCIRVHPTAARWLYYNFIKVGTTVIVMPYR